jgi:hypothetical protein
MNILGISALHGDVSDAGVASANLRLTRAVA